MSGKAEHFEEEHDETAEQTKPKSHPIAEFFNNGDNILDQMKISTLTSILFKKKIYNDKYDKFIMENYKSRMGFYITTLFNQNFDIFTPPQNYLQNYDSFILFEFYEQLFKMIGKNEKNVATIDFGYELNIVPVLECLETGIITKNLYKLIEKMRFKKWNNGSILAKCVDYRLLPIKEFYKRLVIGPELIDYHSSRLLQDSGVKEKLEFEQQALLLANPILCDDPSSDVARINSAIDWRKKIWYNYNPPSKETMTKKKHHEYYTTTARVSSIYKKPNISQEELANIFGSYQV
ncbi:hypothetical protein TRFO_02409 [Tritrichomonas foetus]|uniref:Uncharacterized protein n=1 Tax=Tritrichomonas foetus TaxID=1144522 RepID=A0A1J4J6R1_9EUKA|nr:hypothetical protein TRFO_02409 [Tritrichomonas foetus]|eukprot:OHS93871.1 hypothetical protein TRFO_02409 [Tritrichomonas foetus]